MLGWDTVVAVVALAVGVLALLSDRGLRRRDALAKLLERFEAGGFHTLLWRMEQVTRPLEKDADPLERGTVAEFKKRIPETSATRTKKELIDMVLGRDWGVQRAVMHEVYFFALETHAWLIAGLWPAPGRSRLLKQRTRLLNDSFGYRLVSTLLNHRTIALRLARSDVDDLYYPSHYGCLDTPYIDLLDRLIGELRAPRRVRVGLQERWEITRAELSRREGRAA